MAVLVIYHKTIAPSEIRWGILKIPRPMQGIFPRFDSAQRRNQVITEIGGGETKHLYDNDYGRLRGMKRVFTEHGVEAGDTIEIIVLEPFKRYRLVFRKTSTKRIWTPP